MDGITQQKNQTDRPILEFFLLPHGVIHAKKVKRGPVALFFY